MREYSFFDQKTSFYIRQLKGEYKNLSSAEVNLYRALLDKSNIESFNRYKKYCVEFFFPASQSELMTVTGLSNKTFQKARKGLQEAGLIRIRAGKVFGDGNGKPIAEYSIFILGKITQDKKSNLGKITQDKNNQLRYIYPSKDDSTWVNLPNYIDNREYIFLDTEEKKKQFFNLPEEDQELAKPWLIHLDEVYNHNVYDQEFINQITWILGNKKEYGTIRLKRIIAEACCHPTWKNIDFKTINNQLSKMETNSHKQEQLQPVQIKDSNYMTKEVQEEIQ